MNARVLLAEDDEDIGRVVMQKLTNAAIPVTWKKSGQDAWNAVQIEKPALAILDVDLPGMTGLDVLGRIKSTPETRGTVVVMITVLGHDAYVGEALRRGASACLVKPFRPGELLARVQGLLAAPVGGATA
jgi:DNA-binding response OmpR family regulator